MSDRSRVLVVEDEWLIAEDVASELRAAGYPVVGPVSSVAAALQLVEADKVDVALLDIQLNAETSLPVAEVLLARGTPFAFVTGFGERDVPAPFRSCKFVAKPASETDILTAVAELASLRAARKQS
ncbi:response regulator [Mesorhizobium sp. B2-1-8]|uniref:response regulator n=1 Tax=unclassified Mesorhizobium TaxID=325217 RepID=UPI00112AD163|nr:MULTISPECIES: response regulator [unclassified Mesorhizobium]MBZ9673228.1 response regulator [Mesorhizobium sp. ES1-3]MBZ9706817.1 response regulator [Mesorhizobium sp. ESP7-2]TPI32447.1 response regulator [Mesorhizobium sp. B3-2-1]UCI18291.1 response regulator [Mesorhizobium sp. B2-1-8]